MTGYPLLLDVSARRVVVVGGGTIATRRVTALLEAGADVPRRRARYRGRPGRTRHRLRAPAVHR